MATNTPHSNGHRIEEGEGGTADHTHVDIDTHRGTNEHTKEEILLFGHQAARARTDKPPLGAESD